MVSFMVQLSRLYVTTVLHLTLASAPMQAHVLDNSHEATSKCVFLLGLPLALMMSGVSCLPAPASLCAP